VKAPKEWEEDGRLEEEGAAEIGQQESNWWFCDSSSSSTCRCFEGDAELVLRESLNR